MESIYGSVALRPTRIGFLVRPSQQNFSQVREIIRAATCLWGGMFNPIIPVTGVLPVAWRERHFSEITGRGLAEAYLRFFEPDVFVEAEQGLAKEIGVADERRYFAERVIPLKQLARGDDRRRVDFTFGLSALDIYSELYDEEFKFVSREPRKVAIVENADPYCEAVFGAFPSEAKLKYMQKAYMDVCKPAPFSATAEDCLKLFNGNYLTPLNATLHELDVNFENRDDPTIFVFDPNKTVDLIDFWNLRQFRPNVLPINVHWIAAFEEFTRKFITKNHRPLPGNNHGVMIHTTLEFSRSIEQPKQKAILKAHFENLPQGSFSWKTWYDPIWRTDWKGGGIQPRRAKLLAKEVDIEEAVDETATPRLPSLEPEFASKYSFSNNNARWMNVVKFSNFGGGTSRFALNYPPNIKDEKFPALNFGGVSLSTREGLVLFRKYKSLRASMQLLSQQKAVIGWLETQGIKAAPSSAGRNAEQVLKSVNGTRGSGLFADEGTVRLLDKMAKTIQREADGTTSQYPDRTASVAEWKEVIGRRSNGLFSRAKLSDFTDKNVMRIGMSLNCTHCAKDNWYSLSDLDYEIVCERCLSKFSFPQTGLKFGEGDWRFRVTGPFSVPNYADGAYATALTLRLFNNSLTMGDIPNVFSTGLDVVRGGSKFEVDFVGWYSEGKKFWIDRSPAIVFGETKSFGEDVFKERDVQRLKGMAEAIPGSYVVFAALKKQLSDMEKLRIRRFAEWGRVPQKNGEPRAMIIVLTGTELFADHYLEEAWRDAGGPHAEMIKHPSVNIDDLWTLAEITQQIYLDMPTYWEWREKRRRSGKKPPPKRPN